jgi:subtilase family serine protease
MHKRTLLSVLAAGVFCAGTPAYAGAATGAAAIARAAVLGNAHDLGRLPANAPVRLSIGLQLRNAAELDALLAAQATKSSPLYHHYLRPPQVRDEFGATAADYARVASSLARAGFTIVRNDPLRTSISVSAPARAVERYFSTRLEAIGMPGRPLMHANVTAASVPAEVAGIVSSVSGLSEQSAYTTAAAAAYAAPHLKPAAAPLNGPDGGYGPQDLIAAFDYPIKKGYSGSGVTVADLIDGVVLDSDISTYLTEFGVTRTGPPTGQVDVDGGCTNGAFGCNDSFSAAIDAEGIVGTAPGVNYVVYDIPILFNNYIVDGLRAIVAADAVDVVNVSFAGCETAIGETSLVEDSVFKLGVVQGITFESVAFGGANPCGAVSGFSVQSPPDSPHTLAVGGADSFISPSGQRSRAPIVDGSTGGGVSALFSKPAFQNSVAAGNGRSLPDIAGPAAIDSLGPSVYYAGFGGWIGGFPFIDNAPIAGALAEVAQAENVRLGNFAAELYSLKAANRKKYFYDVTVGCNGAGGVEPYCAGVGYDIVSGLGVPNFATFLSK